MLLNRQWAVFRGTTWCLFACWLLFGGVELAEQAQVLSELARKDQQDSDQDEDALAQLSSGLRTEVLSPTISPLGLTDTATLKFVACCVVGSRRHQTLTLGPPSLRLHQSISIYRI